MKPSFLNLFMKKLTRERVVPNHLRQRFLPKLWGASRGACHPYRTGQATKSARKPLLLELNS